MWCLTQSFQSYLLWVIAVVYTVLSSQSWVNNMYAHVCILTMLVYEVFYMQYARSDSVCRY